ncbi:MAG: hypothetical protein PHY47_12820 [Lachnospiraceae bacterium]|nr:hypothetical protein [Lachnospiraceae bacterium]
MFKIHDIVKVKDNLVCGQTYNGLLFADSMGRSCGKEYRIVDARLRNDGEEMVYVLDYTQRYVFNQSMIELTDKYDNNILLAEIIADKGRL